MVYGYIEKSSSHAHRTTHSLSFLLPGNATKNLLLLLLRVENSQNLLIITFAHSTLCACALDSMRTRPYAHAHSTLCACALDSMRTRPYAHPHSTLCALDPMRTRLYAHSTLCACALDFSLYGYMLRLGYRRGASICPMVPDELAK